MSDEPAAPRVVTAPLEASPAPAPEKTAPMPAKLEPPPVHARPATQMSASAVPSTLESPQEPATDAGIAIGTPPPEHPVAVDEIHGAALLRRDAGDDASVPPDLEATVPASHRGGPATMMSPAVPAPLPGASTPPLAPENAVVDVGAPAHAFVPYAGAAPPGFGGPNVMVHRGPGDAGQRRTTSTTFLVLVIGGAVAAVAVLAVAVVGFFFFTSRRVTGLDDRRSARPPGGAIAPGSPEPPRPLPRFAGTRARLTVTSSGALDPETVRAAIGVALPRIDVCYAATELEPPDHESANYDLDVAPNGEVRHAEPTTAGPRSTKLDACVTQNLRSVRMPRAAKPSVVRLTFSAPIEPR